MNPNTHTHTCEMKKHGIYKKQGIYYLSNGLKQGFIESCSSENDLREASGSGDQARKPGSGPEIGDSM